MLVAKLHSVSGMALCSHEYSLKRHSCSVHPSV